MKRPSPPNRARKFNLAELFAATRGFGELQVLGSDSKSCKSVTYNGSLDEWLFGFGVLPWTRRLKVVKDVAEALSYLHSKGLAHKNLKASSVFIDISFRAILGDFGFALSSADSTRFESSINQKVDIFEFGVLVLKVVSGRGRKKSNPGELGWLDLEWAMHESDEKSTLVDRRMGLVFLKSG